MLHIKKLMGMHNKEIYTGVYMCVCARIDIRVYAKYVRIIRVYVVRIYLSCTVVLLGNTLLLFQHGRSGQNPEASKSSQHQVLSAFVADN